MGFWDAVEKALDKVVDATTDGADRAVSHVADDLDKVSRGQAGASIWGLKGDEPKSGDTFSWWGESKKGEGKSDGGVSWW